MSNSAQHKTTIASLPWEIIANVLILAAEANITEGYAPSYTYGLSQVSRTLQLHHKVQVQKHITGRIPPDILRWKASDAIRQTCSVWHEWALGYNFKELYVRRWRGGESWDPKFLALPSPSGGPLTSDIFPVVYQDPYRTLKSTVTLFQHCPHLASHVRRLWFTGIYQFSNLELIFKIIRGCQNLRSLTLPWSALRYGSVDDWIHITNNLPRLTSLEFLGMDLRQSQIDGDKNINVNCQALEDIRVNFSKIRRLKIHGCSNVQNIVDEDLWEIARTATNLEEVHITGTSTISIAGITALLSASHKSIKVLNFAPLDYNTSGTTHLNPSPGLPKIHFCDVVTSCRNLVDVNVSIPHICEHILCPPPQYSKELLNFNGQSQKMLKWSGNTIIRLPYQGRTCTHPDLPLEHPDSRAQIQEVLSAARRLQQSTRELSIELIIGDYTFTPGAFSVAGDFKEAKKMSEGLWQPEGERDSRKGPWGSSGVWGDAGMKRWTEIGEDDFFEGVRSGLVRFEH
ncbi:hypothetical protein BDZ91DRAFT_709230 [Kalaharituber pfeilii]|nr:hypothetical protein BDZ91DRAFT_709230 [Kalaharituber pfeilii]